MSIRLASPGRFIGSYDNPLVSTESVSAALTFFLISWAESVRRMRESHLVSDFDIFLVGSLSDMIFFAGARRDISIHVLTNHSSRPTKHSFWLNENLAIDSIEAPCTVAGKLKMLTLVLAYWDMCSSLHISIIQAVVFRGKLHTDEREYLQPVGRDTKTNPVVVVYQKVLHCLRVIIYSSIGSYVKDIPRKPYSLRST